MHDCNRVYYYDCKYRPLPSCGLYRVDQLLCFYHSFFPQIAQQKSSQCSRTYQVINPMCFSVPSLLEPSFLLRLFSGLVALQAWCVDVILGLRFTPAREFSSHLSWILLFFEPQVFIFYCLFLCFDGGSLPVALFYFLVLMEHFLQ